MYRKVDNHQLKRLQREEMKETTEFYHRIKGEREVQEKKVETERQEVERRFETVSRGHGQETQEGGGEVGAAAAPAVQIQGQKPQVRAGRLVIQLIASFPRST